MSRDVSLSPKSGDADPTLSLDMSTVQTTVVDEERENVMSQLSFSTPMTTSVAPIEEMEETERDELMKEKERKEEEKEKDRKKSRHKSIDEPRKRKDTATSITNFFHRFTRSENKEEKKIIEEEVEKEVDRPDRLMSPDSSEERWFDLHGGNAADLLGDETDADLYEWEPDTMTEKLVVEPLAHQESTFRASEFEEQSLVQLLDDFRNGELHWLGEKQLEAMRVVKKAHEDVTRTHLTIAQLDDDDDDHEDQVERMFDQLSEKLAHMHVVLDTVFTSEGNDDEYFSS